MWCGWPLHVVLRASTTAGRAGLWQSLRTFYGTLQLDHVRSRLHQPSSNCTASLLGPTSTSCVRMGGGWHPATPLWTFFWHVDLEDMDEIKYRLDDWNIIRHDGRMRWAEVILLWSFFVLPVSSWWILFGIKARACIVYLETGRGYIWAAIDTTAFGSVQGGAKCFSWFIAIYFPAWRDWGF